MGYLKHIGCKTIAPPYAGWEVLDKAIAVKMRGEFGDHSVPERFISERHRTRRLLFHAGVGIVLHEPDHSPEAIRKFLPERNIHASLAWNRIFRFFHGERMGLVHLRDRSLIDPRLDRLNDLLLDLDLIAARTVLLLCCHIPGERLDVQRDRSVPEYLARFAGSEA